MISICKCNKPHDAETNIRRKHGLAGSGTQFKDLHERAVDHGKAAAYQSFLSVIANLVETEFRKEEKKAGPANNKYNDGNKASNTFVFQRPKQNKEAGKKKNMD